MISEFLNNGLPEKYELELSETNTDVETFLYGDSFLLNRIQVVIVELRLLNHRH